MRYLIVFALLTGCQPLTPHDEAMIVNDITQVEKDLMTAELEAVETTKTTKEVKTRKVTPKNTAE